MSSQKHNIYEAFLYKYKKFILALSYTPGFDINPIIEDISKTFSLLVIKLEGSPMLKSDSSFDYNKLNNNVLKLLDDNNDKLKNNLPNYLGIGILIYGLNFPLKSLKFQIDLHLHMSTSLNMFLKTNVSSDGNVLYTVDDYNKLKDLMNDNKIHKYFNIKSETPVELNDKIFDKIIDFIEFKVYGKDYEKFSTKSRKERETKSNEPLVNPLTTDQLEMSKINERIVNQYDDIITDVALSMASDAINPRGKYSNYRKYKKLERSISDDKNTSDSELLTSDSKTKSDNELLTSDVKTKSDNEPLTSDSYTTINLDELETTSD